MLCSFVRVYKIHHVELLFGLEKLRKFKKIKKFKILKPPRNNLNFVKYFSKCYPSLHQTVKIFVMEKNSGRASNDR